MTADLVIEVSYSSLAYDRGEKLALYARAGIPEYWILDVSGSCIEAYRDPIQLPAGPGYASRQLYLPGQSITPLKISRPSCPVSGFFA